MRRRKNEEEVRNLVKSRALSLSLQEIIEVIRNGPTISLWK